MSEPSVSLGMTAWLAFEGQQRVGTVSWRHMGADAGRLPG
jgi:hypothetical protein